MKKYLLALAACVLTSFASAADPVGHIYSILPYQAGDTGKEFRPGAKAKFRIRLYAADYDTPTATAWELKPKFLTIPGETTMEDVMQMLYPLRVGVVVSGQLRPAEIVEFDSPATITGSHPYTDLVCEYVVQHGDLALPLALALKGSTDNKPLIPGVNGASETEYYLYNSSFWDIKCGDVSANLFFCDDTTSEAVGNKLHEQAVLDYSLSKANLRVSGLTYTVEPTIRTPEKKTATITMNEAPTQSTTLYAWSSNEAAVKVVGPETTNIPGVVGSRQVATIVTEAGKKDYAFEIESCGNQGDSTTIILSPTLGKQKDAAGDYLENYLEKPVVCGPQKGSEIKVEIIDPATGLASGAVSVETPLMPADGTGILPTRARVTVFDRNGRSTPLTVTIKAKNLADSSVDPIKNSMIALSTLATRQTYFDPEAGEFSLTIPAGETTADFSIYPLGGDIQLSAKGIQLAPTSTATGYDLVAATYQMQYNHKPVIITPAEGTTYDKQPMGGFKVPLQITDCYHDLAGKFTVDIYYPDSGNSVLIEDQEFSPLTPTEITLIDYVENDTSARIKVYNADEPTLEAETTINFSVKPPKTVKAELYATAEPDSKLPEGKPMVESGVWYYVGFALSEKAGGNRYAFLTAEGDAAAVIDIEEPANRGALISNAGTTSMLTTKIRFKDGTALTSGLVLKTTLSRSATDKTQVDTTFGCEELIVNVLNENASVKAVYIDGAAEPVANDAKGEVWPHAIPSGTDVSFDFEIDDPGELDVQDGIWTLWSFEEGKSAKKANYKAVKLNASAIGETMGSCIYKYSQTQSGETDQNVQVIAIDKDLLASLGGVMPTDQTNLRLLWRKAVASVTPYSFKVHIALQPHIALETVNFTDGVSMTETGNGKSAGLRIMLSDFAKTSKKVRVYAEPVDDDDYGCVAFKGGSFGTNGLAYKDLTIPEGENEPVDDAYVKGMLVFDYDKLNGTAGSQNSGWKIYVKFIDDTGAVVQDDYFHESDEETIYVMNLAPTIAPRQPDVVTTNKTVQLNQAFEIQWTPNDVKADLGAVWPNGQKGLKCEWYINDALQSTKTTYVTTNSVGKVELQKTELRIKTEGFTEVKLVVSDLEGEDYNGTASRVWYYFIQPTKKLQITPVGPSRNTQTKYRSAPGLGQGHVWANGPSTTIENFSQVWNYSITEGEGTIYAIGYQENDKEDGTLGGEFKMDSKGNTADTDFYAYLNPTKNFFYRWVHEIPSENGGVSSYEFEIPEPTLNPHEVKRRSVQLDKWEKDKLSYLSRNYEAIFSREYRAGDGVGDINADGIPDLVAQHFALGGSKVGESPEDDFANLSTENLDGDALPEASRNLFTSTIPGVKDSWLQGLNIFTAKMELRGVHEGLNDALVKLGIPGATYDAATAERDYSPAEWRAYLASGKDPKWSPENPTDPTVEDTDDDGMPDGYEYYYWYWAHVGVIDGNGKWSRLSGEKYNPFNPEKGDLITPEQIEAIVNPTVPYKHSSQSASDSTVPYDDAILDKDSVDSDCDGLPDLLELELGTNPFHWDTDGDGMPDGWEVRQANTDPCKADAGANPDGDYMATVRVYDMQIVGTLGNDGYTKFYVSPALTTEDGAEVKIWKFKEFGAQQEYALIVEDGEDESSFDTYFYKETAPDVGFRYYLKNDQLSHAKLIMLVDGERGRGVQFEKGRELTEPQFTTFTEQVLAAPLSSDVAFTSRAYEAFRYGNVIEYEGSTPFEVFTVAKDITETVKDENGKDKVVYSEVPAGTIVVKKSIGDHIYFIHHQVYQRRGFYFPEGDAGLEMDGGGLVLKKDMGTGFNPLTAWNVDGQGYVSDRFHPPKKPEGDPAKHALWGGLEVTKSGTATDTRSFGAIDEFLVMNFAFACGQIEPKAILPRTQANYGWPEWDQIVPQLGISIPQNERTQGRIEQAWAAWTTNAGVPTGKDGSAAEQGPAADSDGDGCPDGWELYISCGPGTPYPNNHFNNSRRYNPRASGPSECNGVLPAANENRDPITGVKLDDMIPALEFSSTDSVRAYANTPSIVANANPLWINKFFPTDPWSTDTDCDGLTDSAEADFIYGDADFNDVRTDNGGFCIPGGGLNPCSWDTDMDGLPDAWEAQFKGMYITPKDKGKSLPWVVLRDYERRVAAFGKECHFCGGMDGTVPDSYTNGSQRDNLLVNINRDYDYDGLDPWQEYLTGLIRVFRYDDVLSPWKAPADERAFDEELDAPIFTPEQLDVYLRDGEPINPLLANGGLLGVPMTGGSNPNLVFGKFDAWGAYGSKCRRDWDPVVGNWYYFPDGPNHCLRIFDNAYERKIVNALYPSAELALAAGDQTEFTMAILKAKATVNQYAGPTTYASTDPTMEDTDLDGMDDYYELFHGLNPLYGGETGRDVLSDAWGLQISAKNNYWMELNPDADVYDFVKFPWMTGDPAADPDGDDIRNVEEAIQANAQQPSTWLHTDPTPLWMTDTSSPDSFASTSYRWVSTDDQLASEIKGEDFDYDTLQYVAVPVTYSPLGALEPEDLPDGHIWWGITDYNFAFEENEGFDSDHDGLTDYQETSSAAAGQTNPADADDPHRRQAMYFPGVKSALQAEVDPHFAVNSESSLNFLSFTVECWVKPEDITREQVILERAIFTAGANPADAKRMRRNFELGINAAGHFYAAFDHNGTGVERILATMSVEATANEWAHLAATYDGEALKLYVNGNLMVTTQSTLHPATPAVTIITDLGYQYYWGSQTWDNTMHHTRQKVVDLNAIIYGASATSTNALSLATAEWPAYGKFYKGFLDEVRIWDGARSGSEILATYRSRFTYDDLIANRKAVYDAAVKGAVRAVNRTEVSDELPPELMYHYNFSGLFAGASENEVAKVPFGFDAPRAKAVRPEGWATPWLTNITVRSTVYDRTDYIPWIVNAVAHLPRFDGTTQDSVFWSEDYAGFSSAMSMNYDKFAFPHTHELYPIRREMRTALPTQTTHTTQLLEFATDLTTEQKNLRAFTDHASGIDGTELLPLGGAYVKYCSDYWDGQGATTTWEVTGVDEDNDGLADWWEEAIKTSSAYSDITDTTCKRYGHEMTLLDAYRRDLAAGAHESAAGGDKQFAQTADENSNGLPDWWEKLYDLKGQGGPDDYDNDGLSNYVEFLLSEVFKLNVIFDPTQACSARPTTLDYFYPFGSIYVGELFTDHDMIEDIWEDKYAANPNAVSRLKYDSHIDSDNDGWSNGAEARYSQMSREISADQSNHYNSINEPQADYPIPAINMTVTYNGQNTLAVENASLCIAATSDPTLNRAYDAQWLVNGSEDANDETEADKFFVIGRWSNRHVIGNLTPGNIKPESITLQHAFDPASDILVWTVNGDEDAKRGTREEYLDDVRKYSKDNVTLVEVEKDYRNLEAGIYARVDSETRTWTLRLNGSQKVICTVNLDTGAFDIDLGALGGASFRKSGDENGVWISSKDQSYRLAYSTNPSVGMPRQLYLGLADSGHVREGKNAFVVWAETINENGEYDPGEPFGFINDVDVGWNTAKATVELTETHPVFGRINLITGENDRDYWYGTQSGNYTNVVVNPIPSERKLRVRVVRTLINDEHPIAPREQYVGDKNVYLSDNVNMTNDMVVLDKYMDLSVRNYLHEGDFLTEGKFDIDWMDDPINPTKHRGLYGAIRAAREDLGAIDPWKISYRIVFGEGSVDPSETNVIAKVLIARSFDASSKRTIARPYYMESGSFEGGVVTKARPTLQWIMKNNFNSYPAFRIAVYKDAAMTDWIWTSPVMRAPTTATPLADGTRVFSYDLPVAMGEYFPGTKEMLENDAEYYWTVMMYNARYREFEGDDIEWYGDEIEPGKFRLAVPTDTNARGTAPMRVKYFGPKATFETPEAPIRVQAFASPDFTGEPVAGAVVTNMTLLTDASTTNNATICGIPAGTYYFRAYIDSNDDGICQPWESKGYLCGRGEIGTVAFNPTGVKFSTDNLGKTPVLTVYIEDADTDNDCLPDGWEMAMAGVYDRSALDERGTETLLAGTDDSKKNAEIGISINKDLVGELTRQDSAYMAAGGMAGMLLRSIRQPEVAGLILGLEPGADGKFTLPQPTVLENGLTIKGLSLNPAAGTGTITVAAETTGGVESMGPLASAIYAGETTAKVVLKVERAATLGGVWQTAGSVEVTISAGALEREVSFPLDTTASAGFFRVSIEQ